MPFTLDEIREALARHQPTLVAREPDHAEAAVALVLAGAGGDLSLCAIRRAEHPLDPWSGHMALPGGRSSPEDAGPRAAAERETLEEVGIALTEAHWIGPLSHVLVRLGGGDRRMVLSPFVYYLGEELAPFTLSDEVAEAFWIPLSHLWDPRNTSHLEWEKTGTRLLYPAIRFGEHAIWASRSASSPCFRTSSIRRCPTSRRSPASDADSEIYNRGGWTDGTAARAGKEGV